jgi:spore coat polysaccharide biosynthesis protein SpsF
MNSVAIIQARMGSSRLPGKVLKDICGKPMLQRVVERISQAKSLSRVVVATTTSSDDDAIEKFCDGHGIDSFRGSQNDVLDRYHGAAEKFSADTVVRITADCPLADPEIIDLVVRNFLTAGGAFDYYSNINPPTYPDGLDTEVFSRQSLEIMWQEARLKSEREHVTLFIRNHPERFRIGNLTGEIDLSQMRWTVDEPADLEFVVGVYASFGEKKFGFMDVVGYLTRHPGLTELNKGIIRDEGLLKSLREDGLFK